MDNMTPNFPDKEDFMTVQFPESIYELFGDLGEDARTELYTLAKEFYKLGWEDATTAVETVINDLVYIDFEGDN